MENQVTEEMRVFLNNFLNMAELNPERKTEWLTQGSYYEILKIMDKWEYLREQVIEHLLPQYITTVLGTHNMVLTCGNHRHTFSLKLQEHDPPDTIVLRDVYPYNSETCWYTNLTSILMTKTVMNTQPIQMPQVLHLTQKAAENSWDPGTHDDPTLYYVIESLWLNPYKYVRHPLESDLTHGENNKVLANWVNSQKRQTFMNPHNYGKVLMNNVELLQSHHFHQFISATDDYSQVISDISHVREKAHKNCKITPADVARYMSKCDNCNHYIYGQLSYPAIYYGYSTDDTFIRTRKHLIALDTKWLTQHLFEQDLAPFITRSLPIITENHNIGRHSIKSSVFISDMEPKVIRNSRPSIIAEAYLANPHIIATFQAFLQDTLTNNFYHRSKLTLNSNFVRRTTDVLAELSST